MITKILVTIDHSKAIPDLVDLIAGRGWTIDGVKTSEAVLILEMPNAIPKDLDNPKFFNVLTRPGSKT